MTGARCSQLALCAVIQQRDSVLVSITDTYGPALRTLLNMPLISKLAFVYSQGVVNVAGAGTSASALPLAQVSPGDPSLGAGLDGATWQASIPAPQLGTYLLYVYAEGVLIPSAPTVVVGVAPTCVDGRIPTADGLCGCASASLLSGPLDAATCLPLWSIPGAIGGSAAAALILATLGGLIIWWQVQHANDNAWRIKYDDVEVDVPPVVLGQGSYGIVLQGYWRGSSVALKRAITSWEAQLHQGGGRGGHGSGLLSGSGLHSSADFRPGLGSVTNGLLGRNSVGASSSSFSVHNSGLASLSKAWPNRLGAVGLLASPAQSPTAPDAALPSVAESDGAAAASPSLSSASLSIIAEAAGNGNGNGRSSGRSASSEAASTSTPTRPAEAAAVQVGSLAPLLTASEAASPRGPLPMPSSPASLKWLNTPTRIGSVQLLQTPGFAPPSVSSPAKEGGQGSSLSLYVAGESVRGGRRWIDILEGEALPPPPQAAARGNRLRESTVGPSSGGAANEDFLWSSSSLPEFPGPARTSNDRWPLASRLAWLWSLCLRWCGLGGGFTRRRRSELVSEIRRSVFLRHPKLVTTLGAILEPGKPPVLVLELMERGTLSDLLANASVEMADMALPIIRDVVEGMTFLSLDKPPLVHGDLKARRAPQRCLPRGVLPILRGRPPRIVLFFSHAVPPPRPIFTTPTLNVLPEPQRPDRCVVHGEDL